MSDGGTARQQPLAGCRLVVTRPLAQSAGIVEALRDAGAEVIVAPMIRTESLASSPAMQEAVAGIGATDWLVFTSAAGADAFFDALALAGLNARALASARVAAIGPATAARLSHHGVSASVVPSRYTSEALLGALVGTGAVAGKSVLLPRSDIAPRALAEGLRRAGARVVEVAAYRTTFESRLPGGLADQLAAGTIDLVLFTSASAVRAFVAAARRTGRDDCLAAARGASIGPATSQAVREAGISIEVEAVESTAAGLVRAIVRHVATARGTHTLQD